MFKCTSENEMELFHCIVKVSEPTTKSKTIVDFKKNGPNQQIL